MCTFQEPLNIKVTLIFQIECQVCFEVRDKGILYIELKALAYIITKPTHVVIMKEHVTCILTTLHPHSSYTAHMKETFRLNEMNSF